MTENNISSQPGDSSQEFYHRIPLTPEEEEIFNREWDKTQESILPAIKDALGGTKENFKKVIEIHKYWQKEMERQEASFMARVVKRALQVVGE